MPISARRRRGADIDRGAGPPNEITFGERVNDRRNMKAREALSCEDLSDILIYCDEWDATSKPAGPRLVRMGRCFTSLQDGWA